MPWMPSRRGVSGAVDVRAERGMGGERELDRDGAVTLTFNVRLKAAMVSERHEPGGWRFWLWLVGLSVGALPSSIPPACTR